VCFNVHKASTHYLNKMCLYNLLRRSLRARRCVRYPNFGDCRPALDDFDYHQLVNVEQAVVELRDHYAAMHHDIVISGNWQTIIEPRVDSRPHIH